MMDRNRKLGKEGRARCGDCRCLLRNPLFRLCRTCAERERLCQHCHSSTLTQEERDAAERYDRWFSSYKVVVKAHGIRSDEARAHLDGCDDDELREQLAGLTIREIDWPGAKIG